MPNYQNGKIYMIESISNNCRYYGSTIQSLALRLGKHRNDIKMGRNPSSKKVLKYSDARILLVELFPCNSKMELKAKEANILEITIVLINKYHKEQIKNIKNNIIKIIKK
jgi:hypothetical protein